jgi:hypothetical protein
MNTEKKQAIRFLEEAALEMHQILWAGICINLTNVMASLKVMSIINILHIMKVIQDLGEELIKEKNG